MSIEQILLLVFFLVLPVVQYLLGAARQRDGHRPEQAEGHSSPAHRPAMREPQPSRNPPLPRVQARPSPPATAGHTLSDAIAAREPTPTREAVAPAPTAGRRAQRGAVVVGLRNRLDLRHAIVLMTIVGACRAKNPHDWPERAGDR
ncbi:MAG: hypothetical protein ACRD7E_06680 [Bryobacteraceae bacterium]